ncbi:MAG: hypothetical protein GY832_22350 [Chloroflexi bacterium]|nr:hypothetical protein [Chloroflexota bacterium]
MRTCIFCQEQASSKEDIWPQWLTKRFPLSNASRMEAERGGHKLGTWQINTPQLLLSKCVCRNCNNGWMSQLEQEMKPIVDSILDERLKVLDVSSQAVIAVWATKTAMVLETLYPKREFFYSEIERQCMHAVSAIPERTSIWIAQCVNQPNIYSAGKDLQTASGDSEAKAYVTTMAFGSLAFQVVSIRSSANLSREIPITYDLREGPWDEVLLQVWPLILHSQQWPPSQGLNGELGLEALTDRLKVP